MIDWSFVCGTGALTERKRKKVEECRYYIGWILEDLTCLEDENIEE